MTEMETLTRLHGSRLLSELTVERRDIKARCAATKQANPTGPTLPKSKPPSLESRLAEIEKFISEIAPYQVKWLKSAIRGSDKDFGGIDPLGLIPKTPKIAEIMRLVGGYFSVTTAEMTSIRRQSDLVRARWIAMYLCKIFTRRSFVEIGRYMGGRDHSSVMHVMHTIKERVKTDEALAKDIDFLKACLEAKYPTKDAVIGEG